MSGSSRICSLSASLVLRVRFLFSLQVPKRSLPSSRRSSISVSFSNSGPVPFAVTDSTSSSSPFAERAHALLQTKVYRWILIVVSVFLMLVALALGLGTAAITSTQVCPFPSFFDEQERLISLFVSAQGER